MTEKDHLADIRNHELWKQRSHDYDVWWFTDIYQVIGVVFFASVLIIAYFFAGSK